MGVRGTSILHLWDQLGMGVQSGSCTPKVAEHGAARVLHYFWLAGQGDVTSILLSPSQDPAPPVPTGHGVHPVSCTLWAGWAWSAPLFLQHLSQVLHPLEQPSWGCSVGP